MNTTANIPPPPRAATVPTPSAKVAATDNLTGRGETWDDMDVEVELKQFGESDGRQLKDYPPRTLPDGTVMQQRKVRTRIGGQVDVDNIQKAYDDGWRPRPASTLAGYIPRAVPGFDIPVIGISGHVLFERHPKLDAVETLRVDEKRRAQLSSVKATLTERQYGPNGSYGAVRVDELKSHVRRPAQQTDDD